MAKSATKITNIGAKIGGSRKDLARMRISLSQFDEMNSEERINLIKKDKVWPEPDWDKLAQEGMEPEVAAKIKTIRRNLAVAPKEDYRGHPASYEKCAALYVEMVDSLATALLPCKTEVDLVLAINEYKQKYRQPGPGRTPPLASSRNRDNPCSPDWFQIWKGNESPLPELRFNKLIFSYTDEKRMRKELKEGFPYKQNKKPAWMKTLVIRNVRVKQNKDDADYTDMLSAQFQTAKRVEHVGYYLSEEEAIKGAKTYYEEKKANKMGLPERPHVENFARRGPDYRRGYNVSAEQLMRDFGFRGIEFGEWLPNDERQIVINAAWVACHDLADAIGINPRGVGLNGTLALALGARGKGHANAHFEPGKRVMNLTRMRGAGSLAHEWAHALDFFIANSRAPEDLKSEGGSLRYASGGRLKFNDKRGKSLSFLPNAVVEQVNSVLHSFLKIKLTKEEDIALWANAIKAEETIRERYETAKARDKKDFETKYPDEDAPQHMVISTQHRLNAWNNSIERCNANIKRMEEAVARLELGGETRSVQTDYASNAAKIGAGDYWTRPTELFARAFESWVEDRLNNADGIRKSPYLVHSTDPAIYQKLADLKLIAANPYPAGRERKVIGEAFERFMAVVGPEYGLRNEAPRPLNAITARLPEPEAVREELSAPEPQ
ncbi:LPD1 domain-containing protein [Acetobacter persici]|uniref:Large polyvalent protein-associated domain-containing protein n=1 Tax=Acetobacter persici TaxID=1076596 RepID=A0A1U9LIY2_9PROT|nr:LPD1 domain-containing protein [Acetobacter persici]AQT06415.1 hypothetical protein A0U91_15490 [Acetobacter persici]